MTKRPSANPFVLGLSLVAGTFLAYQPVWHAGFIWDDDTMLTGNFLVQRASGLREIWFGTELPDFFPLTSTSFWLEYRLWGINPAGYHLVNVLLHAASSVLLWHVWRRLEIPGAWLAALIFAVHPVNVESVAWIAERKNTLSMFFCALALLFFLRFDAASRTNGRAPQLGRWYWLSLGAFLLSLLAKTSGVMLPFVLLLIVWWRQGRLEGREILRATPFFIASLVLGLVTIWFQTHRAIGSEMVRTDGFANRLAGAGWAVWFYVGKALVPVKLTFVYPRWEINPYSPVAWVPLGVLLAALVGLWKWRERLGRAWLTGFGSFVLLLAPVLGFFNIFFNRFSLVADHWQYFALTGIVALVVGSTAAVLARLESRAAPKHKRSWWWCGRAAGAVVVVSFGVLTWNQAHLYSNNETLWRTTLKRNPRCAIAQNNLGEILFQRGQFAEARALYEAALETNPDYAELHNNLGNVLFEQGHLEEAIAQYRAAIEGRLNYAEPHYNLGRTLFEQGRVDDAIAQYEMALRAAPTHSRAHYNLGNALLQKGRSDEAIGHYQKALEAEPAFADARNNLANALLQKGRADEAIVEYQLALQTRPEDAATHFNLANALLQKGRPDEAIAHYEAGLKLNPLNAGANLNLANALLLKGCVDEAIAQFGKGLALNPTDAAAHNNLGSALLQKERVADAVTHFQKALELRPGSTRARFNLGLALLQAGRRDDARLQFQELLHQDPQFVLPPDVQRSLESQGTNR